MKLVEAVIALFLGLVLVTGVWRASALVRGQVAVLERAAAEADARRVAGMLLDLEAADRVEPIRGGEVPVRAYRWWGVPCASGAGGVATGPLMIVWQGLRRPDPVKDSVVLVAADGRRQVVRVVGVAGSSRCAGAGLALTLEGPIGGEPVLVRGFERGAYRIDDAFRYRRGTGGAQPLTAAVFDPDSVFLGLAAGALRLRVDPWPTRAWWTP